MSRGGIRECRRGVGGGRDVPRTSKYIIERFGFLFALTLARCLCGSVFFSVLLDPPLR